MKTTHDGDCPEWTSKDFATAKRLTDLPTDLQGKLCSRGQRGPQKSPTKEQVTLRLSADVLAGLRATGPGWQVRTDEALRAWLKRQSRPAVKA